MRLRVSHRCAALLLLAGAAAAADISAGRILFREGILASGDPVTAVVAGDVPTSGRQWRCAACHGRSGMGSLEGITVVPPVTAEALFDSAPSRPVHDRLLPAHARPPYSRSSLAAAVCGGVDSAGNLLSPAMPRFQLGPADLSNLTAYLESLGRESSAGADASALHFAAIVTPGVSPIARDSLLSVLTAWFAQENREADYHDRKRGRAAWDMEEEYEASRHWTLDIWEPAGPPETWTAQLETFYRRRPVFAVVGGVAAGSWQPVADFCDLAETPCLFPETPLPGEHAGGGYSVYFSAGVRGEAEALATWLRRTGVAPHDVLQLYGNAEAARAGAEAFRAAFPGVATAPGTVLPSGKHPAALVVWSGAADFPQVDCSVPLYLSATLYHGPEPCPSTAFVYPFALIAPPSKELARMRNWQLSRGIPSGDERIQLDAQFTMRLLDYCIAHMLGHYSKEYLLEMIEHETELTPQPGVFPPLSLGPGQRFASKGAYIVGSRLQALSEWIVP